MQLQVNGKPLETCCQTLGLLLQELQMPATGIAVAVNGSVIRRAHHPEYRLTEGDHIEIIRAVQGG